MKDIRITADEGHKKYRIKILSEPDKRVLRVHEKIKEI